MKLTKEELDNVMEAAYEARRRVSKMSAKKKTALLKRARKFLSGNENT